MCVISDGNAVRQDSSKRWRTLDCPRVGRQNSCSDRRYDIACHRLNVAITSKSRCLFQKSCHQSKEMRPLANEKVVEVLSGKPERQLLYERLWSQRRHY